MSMRLERAIDEVNRIERKIQMYQNQKREAMTRLKLVENYETGVDMPKLYFCCGTHDFLYEGFKVFRAFCEEKGYNDIVFEEEPGHGHEWRFWDMYIERIINLYISDTQKPVSF